MKFSYRCDLYYYENLTFSGADSGGGGGGAPGARPPKIGKNMIFWRKIVIFHTKYLNNFRASLDN
jgi:hypothetical protein